MHQDSFGSYITFSVNTTTTRPAFSAPFFTVLRRFSDFDWVSNVMAQDNPGVIIPAMPEKQTVGRFSPEFIEARRRGLERFMAKIAAHATLSESKHFISFLTVDQVAFKFAKDTVKQEKAAEKPSTLDQATSWFSRTAVSVVQAVSSKQVVIEKSAADFQIEEILDYLNQLETNLEKCSLGSSQLVKKNIDMSNAYQEFGQSFTAFGLIENDSHGVACTEFGGTISKLAATTNEFAEANSLKLEEPLQDFVRLVANVKAAVGSRQEKRKCYVHAVNDLDSKQQSHQKAVGENKQELVSKKLRDVEVAQDTVDKTKKELENITDVFLMEFEHFKQEKVSCTIL